MIYFKHPYEIALASLFCRQRNGGTERLGGLPENTRKQDLNLCQLVQSAACLQHWTSQGSVCLLGFGCSWDEEPLTFLSHPCECFCPDGRVMHPSHEPEGSAAILQSPSCSTEELPGDEASREVVARSSPLGEPHSASCWRAQRSSGVSHGTSQTCFTADLGHRSGRQPSPLKSQEGTLRTERSRRSSRRRRNSAPVWACGRWAQDQGLWNQVLWRSGKQP